MTYLLIQPMHTTKFYLASEYYYFVAADSFQKAMYIAEKHNPLKEHDFTIHAQQVDKDLIDFFYPDEDIFTE